MNRTNRAIAPGFVLMEANISNVIKPLNCYSFKAAARSFLGLKMIQNIYLRQYITIQPVFNSICLL